MEKPQLVNFIAKVLEDSGFKVYKNFKTSQQVVDIYAILQTSMGDFGLVVACKNYDKDWEVGIDVLKEMEVIGKKLRASKVAVVTSSGFTSQAKRYAEERKIKLIDRNNLVTLAKKYSNKNKETKPRLDRRSDRLTDIDSDSFYHRDVNREYIDNTSNYRDYDDDRSYNRLQGAYEGYEEFSEDMEYYEDEVGGLELSHYSEYDDELYRAEFLNKTPRD
ncbi:MAG: restriction endonuclease, partial [Methanobrevibacter sp.]|nr:restriction endonuclease [Methanobrevibacter sp.]